jgi:hypothetical protein
MLGRRSCSDNNVGEEGEGGGCCGRGSRRDVPASRGGRSAPHRKRLFSAERGRRARGDRSCSDLGLSSCGKGGGRFALKAEVLKAKGTGRLGTTCVAKSRGWDMPRNRPGVRLGSCRHGEWHGPARLRPGGQHQQLAGSMDVMPAQAGQLDRLDDIGSPPASLM